QELAVHDPRVAHLQHQALEVDLAERAHHRHHDVLDQRGHDLAEGGADDHGHRQVDDVPLDCEFTEFLDQAHRYVTSRISSFSSPAGVCIVTVSPSRALINARAIGETHDTRPCEGSTSSTPTIVTLFSPDRLFSFTVAPKNTWSVSRPDELTISAPSSRLIRKRTRRSISRSRRLP